MSCDERTQDGRRSRHGATISLQTYDIMLAPQRPWRYRLRWGPSRPGGDDGRALAANDDGHQGEDLEAARQGRGSRRSRSTTRTRSRSRCSRTSSGHRRRRDREEAPRDADVEARAGRRQARRPGPSGARRRARGPRPLGARAQDVRPAAAPGPRPADRGLEAQQEKLIENEKRLVGEGRELPQPEGGHQGPVLGGRGAGARSARRRAASARRWPTSAWRSSARRTRPRTCRPAPRRSTSSSRQGRSRTSPAGRDGARPRAGTDLGLEPTSTPSSPS